jgi:hypothetical protein
MRIRLNPCLEPCQQQKKYYCLEEKMTQKWPSGKNATKIIIYISSVGTKEEE